MTLASPSPSSIRQAVAFAGAGLIGVATGLPVRDFVDAAIELMSGGEIDPFAQVAKTVLSDLPSDERDAVSATVRDVVVASRITLREAVDLEGRASDYDTRRFTGIAVADHAMTVGAEYLKGLSPSERDRVASILATIFRAYLASPGTLEKLHGDAIAAIFGLGARLEAVESETHKSLSSFAVGKLLDTGSRPLPTDRGPDSWLLRPEYGIVPFHPVRRPDVDSLVRWAEKDDVAGLRLLHGPGGLGKTRLAAEVSAILRERGWSAGFLSELANEAPAEALRSLIAQPSVVVVVDYAETRREQLEVLLSALAEKREGKARILMLARAKADWWDAVDRSSAPVQRLMQARGIAATLAPIASDPSLRQDLLDNATKAFGAIVGPPARPTRKMDLSASDFALPLFVHMAALAAARGLPMQTGDEMLADLLTRERRFWDAVLEAQDLNPSVFAPLVAQSVAVITATGGCRDEADVLRRVRRVPLARGLPELQLRAVSEVVCSLYPMSGQLGALGPDVVGEQLAADEFRKDQELFGDVIRA